MRITVEKVGKQEKCMPTFDELEPGTVFEFDRGALALKLEANIYVLLTYSSGTPWFVLGDRSMENSQGIAKVHGKLVGVKVE